MDVGSNAGLFLIPNYGLARQVEHVLTEGEVADVVVRLDVTTLPADEAEDVHASAASHVVSACAADQDVVPIAAVQGVIASAASQRVVTRQAIHHVIAGQGIDVVVA